MRVRRPHILFARLVVGVLIAVMSVGAWAGPALGGVVACGACSDDVPRTPVEQAHACCGGHGDSKVDGPASGASDEVPPSDCCPDGCGRCYQAPARVPVASVDADSVKPPAGVVTLPSTPSTLPPPAGVRRLIFYPPATLS